jgi:hypothetical protein
MAIAPGAVQDGMDIKRVASDREKYPKRETLGQYATYAITRSDDAKVTGVFLGAVDRVDDLIGQFNAQAGALIFIPRRRFSNVLQSERADDDPERH